ncbi:hypothetical protein [Cohnella silvisoli]|uniref:Uncharacterized protein n=1 Tax=Cohnella silvisoli TaxID=2873699 RepID=A0ABV1KNB7_9BACL|nr:hypothetical protein [Cohnella silvisoli]MCD9020572.1 hypothetical protein [Cohnella silvisoli]
MTSKKVMINFSVILLLGLVIAYGFYSTSQSNNDSGSMIVHTDNKVVPLQGVMAVDGIYGDISRSLQEMQENSDTIVYGTVLSQEHPNDMVVLSNVEVIKQWKGEVTHQTVIIHQFASDALEVGKNYYLYLGKQGGAKENSYFIKGGHQGDILVDNGKLVSHDSTIKDEITKLESDVSSFAKNATTEDKLANFLDKK